MFCSSVPKSNSGIKRGNVHISPTIETGYIPVGNAEALGEAIGFVSFAVWCPLNATRQLSLQRFIL